MGFYLDYIHTDICEQSVITCWLSAIEMLITQIQAHSPQNTQTYMKTAEEEKKRNVFCAIKFAKLRPIRWQVRHSVRHASSRGSARIQIINLPCIFDFFFLDDFILFGTLSATKSCWFFTTKTLFLSVICSITDTNNSSPSRDET